MKLYTNKVAPNPRRVAIVLAEKGIELPTVEIDLANRGNYEPEFMQRNPLARVPVLELDDGSYLAESIAICRYFEERQPDPPLFGRDHQDRALVEMWDRRMEHEVMLNVTSVFRHLHPYWNDRIRQVAEYGEICRTNLDERMAWLDGELVDRPFIAGEAFSIADITAVAAFDLGRVSKIRISEDHANLSRWYQEMGERPSVASTRP